VRCKFTLDPTFALLPGFERYVGLVVRNEDPTAAPSGTVWFDDISVQESCPENDIVVSMETEARLDESKRFFNQKVSECDASGAGCTEFIRTIPGIGTNILPNSSFERWQGNDPEGWTHSGGNIARGEEGVMFGSAYVVKDGEANLDVLPAVPIRARRNYIASFSARKGPGPASDFSLYVLYDSASAGNNRLHAITFDGSTSFAFSDSWQRYESDIISFPNAGIPADATNIRLRFNEDTGGIVVHIDAAMLEEVPVGYSGEGSSYADYGAKNTINLKKPPAYLGCSGDPETDHSLCAKYAPVCLQNEVGCQSYAPTAGGPDVPGIISEFDWCPKECVGYDTFKQSATYFHEEEFPVFFIPDSAQACTANDAGCSEFTNLDEVSRGGEGREYFKFLRQCQRPNNDCKGFYTWIGSDVEGYQLQVYSLVDSNNDSVPDEIQNTRTDLGSCTGPEDVIDNPNCREFFSNDPTIPASYVIIQNTISCTDSCVPYRLSDTDKTSCEQSGGYWGVCTLPAGTICTDVGGVTLVGSNECWDRENPIGALSGCSSVAGTAFTSKNQCIYQAVPGEGETCSAQNASCREYRGNSSGNIREVFADNFESGTTQNWSVGTISNDALAVGGHSILTANFAGGIQAVATDYASRIVDTCDNTQPEWNADLGVCVMPMTGGSDTCNVKEGDTMKCGILDRALSEGAEYILTFWAKTGRIAIANPEQEIVRLRFRSANNAWVDIEGASSEVRVGMNWQAYSIGPFHFGAGDVDTGLRLVLASDAVGIRMPVHYDFVSLRLVQEYEYRIKNSWNTPESCDTNPFTDPPAPAAQFMLGCQEYVTDNGSVINLKSFNSLCRESSVGCERLIDTRNSDSYLAESHKTESLAGNVEVESDAVSYYVNRPEFSCFSEALGCRAFGEPTISDDEDLRVERYRTTYLIDDPDRYGNILCDEESIGCEQFVSEQDGVVFFKSPNSRTCEYRQIPGSFLYGWFKEGSISSFPDCPTASNELGVDQPGRSCVGGDRAGGVCQSDANCTGGGTCVPWTGSCPGELSSCNAYIDPMSQIETTILRNGNFESYYRVCEANTTIPCDSSVQCPIGDTCGTTDEFTRLYFWGEGGPNDSEFTSQEGVGRSSGIRIVPLAGRVSQSQRLDRGLHTILVHVKNSVGGAPGSRIEIVSSPGTFGNFDNSLQISADGSRVTLAAYNSSAEYRTYAGRFYVTRPGAQSDISIIGQGIYDNIELKKTGIYYYLADDVDMRSCNGTVDRDSGCVLFNDTSEDFLTFGSIDTKNGNPPILCGGDTGVICDSNAVIRVTPDRTCGAWLECITGRQNINYTTGKEERLCQVFAQCDSINPINGKCQNFPAVNQEPLEFRQGDVGLMKNFSGYSKVGFVWPGEVTRTEGYYPYAAMEQRKICVLPIAKFGQECLEDHDCQTSAHANDGVCQAVLDVSDNNTIYESCRIYPEGGSPRWGDAGPVDTGDNPAAHVFVDLTNPLGAFDSLSLNNLKNASECTYYKNTSRHMVEGMRGFCVEKDPRSPYLCLNWLPVDEITGGLIGVSGWIDRQNIRSEMYYCLEGSVLENRKVGYRSKCYRQAWYETLASFAGFLVPIYGGIIGTTGVVANYYTVGSSGSCGEVICPAGYIASVESARCGSIVNPGTKCRWRCIPDPNDYKFTDNKNFDWYDYRDRIDVNQNYTKNHIMYTPEGPTLIYNPEEQDPKEWLRMCDVVAKVTNNNSANKAWKKRLETIPQFTDYGYVVPDYGYRMETINQPFGSIGSRWRGDPTTWDHIIDRLAAVNTDRPYFSFYEGGENVGQIYHDEFSVSPYGSSGAGDHDPLATTFHGGRERVKRLFAESFGYWYWDGSAYREMNEGDQRCVGGYNDGENCAADAGICTDTSSSCLSGGHCAYVDATDPNNVITVVADNLTCGDNPNGTSATCQSYIYCSFGYCTTGDPETSSGNPCNTDTECAATGETCRVPLAVDQDSFGVCTLRDADNEQVLCQYNEQCANHPDGNLGNCTGKGSWGDCSTGVDSGSACNGANPCNNNINTTVCVGSCSGASAIAGQDCSRDFGAGAGANSADLSCRISGQCESFDYWTPPTENCPNDVRPTSFNENPVPGNTGDWCGITPQVYNIVIENSPSPIFTIRGQQEITLKFNVRVDDDQLPLRLLDIDWGDGQPNTRIAPANGVYDKRDAADPYIFTHTYFYDPTIDANISGGIPTGQYRHRITIRVKDNWGWCSCDKSRLPAGSSCIRGEDDSLECNPPDGSGESIDRIPVNTEIRVCRDAAVCP